MRIIKFQEFFKLDMRIFLILSLIPLLFIVPTTVFAANPCGEPDFDMPDDYASMQLKLNELREYYDCIEKNYGVDPCDQIKNVERDDYMMRMQDALEESNYEDCLKNTNADSAFAVYIFGDKIDFSNSVYQNKSEKIRFENGNGDVIHRLYPDTPLSKLFETIPVSFNEQCFTLIDGKNYCNNPDFGTKWYIFLNGNNVPTILDYVIKDNDRILIAYTDSPNNLNSLFLELSQIEIINSDQNTIVEKTTTQVNQVYTYSEIYAIADDMRFDCEVNYGPPFGSTNQQFSYNNCMNRANTWELDQLDRTDYYGEPKSSSSQGGGCLIATATFDSELAPQVQKLREIRDSKLLQTESGSQFMEHFNSFYYSFSPYIADYERENPVFKEIVKVGITPMISTLSLMDYADTESEVLGIGISLIILNAMMYVGLPVFGIMIAKKRF